MDREKKEGKEGRNGEGKEMMDERWKGICMSDAFAFLPPRV
jgi:hypothetical protein